MVSVGDSVIYIVYTKSVESAFHAFSLATQARGSFVLSTSQLARVVSKMVSWFPTVTGEEILAVYEAAAPAN